MRGRPYCVVVGGCLGMGSAVLNPSCESEAPGHPVEYDFVRGLGHQCVSREPQELRAKVEAMMAMAL